MRKLAWAIGVLALAGAGGYFFVYLYRWEWHRAILIGVPFLAAEIALGVGLVLRRLARLEQGGGRSAGEQPDPLVVQRLREAAPKRDRFAWLAAPDRTHVFIPVLLGGGVILSGLAWLVEKVAGSTAEPAMEEDLAGRLQAIAFPRDGLIADDAELLAQEGPFEDDPELRMLLGPTGSRR